ncbi:sugar phosphate isomerase/epimerase family protein [Flavobacterium sp. LT1R49]|uniref:sugar phosphate isomerase/epimerase family protein n=1 Tax=Flavobacterium arabinosi TaxID=3398737 RepID=UPI003A88C3AB
MKRRQFLQSTALFSVATLLNANEMFAKTPLVNILGLGLFSIPKMLENNFDSTFAMLAEMGYKEVECFGPYEFSTEKAKASWNSVTPRLGFKGSGFFNNTASGFFKAAKSNGISIPSMHTDFDTLSNNMGPLAEAAHLIGAKYVVLPSIPDIERKNLDDYKRVAEKFNSIGAEAKKEGIRFAYHNHGYGLNKVNGVMPLDIIFDQTDPSLVYFEMDIYWTIAGGADPVELFKKHKGRYKMMHIKDMKEAKRFSGDGGDVSQRISLYPYITSCGEGVLDLPKILTAAKQNGVEHFFVEQDMVQTPEIALKKSIDYLKTL